MIIIKKLSTIVNDKQNSDSVVTDDFRKEIVERVQNWKENTIFTIHFQIHTL